MFNFVKRFFKESKKTPLGRWDLKNSNVKSLLANIDSCGDTLCGQPDRYRKEIEKQIKLDEKTKI